MSNAGGGYNSIFDKLTDTSLYTGSHKFRFDAEGKGLGIAGRDRVSKGNGFVPGGPELKDLSQITRPHLNSNGAVGSPANRPSTYTPYPHARTASPGRVYQRVSVTNSVYTRSPTGVVTGTPRYSSSSRGRTASGSEPPTGSSADGQKKLSLQPSIFDKLTDTSLYTGAHKYRFDAAGNGLGIAGRSDGEVNDLSQLLRQ